MWGLTAPRSGQGLSVFRHDVRETAELPDVRRETPLSASELEAELIRRDPLSIEWDDASRFATVLECGPHPRRPTFGAWWIAPGVDTDPAATTGGSYGFGGSW